MGEGEEERGGGKGENIKFWTARSLKKENIVRLHVHEERFGNTFENHEKPTATLK